MKSQTISALALVLGMLMAAGAQAVAETEQIRPSRSMTGAEARNNNPEGEGMSKSAPSALGKADRAFMTKAAGNGLFEIAAAKLAAQRAMDPHIKAFAATLAREHGQAQASLEKVALEHNYPLPSQPPEEKRPLLVKMAALSGADFDRVFRDEVGVKAHQADIKLLERARRSTRTPDLKQWIDQTLPQFKAHLVHARSLEADPR